MWIQKGSVFTKLLNQDFYERNASFKHKTRIKM